MQIIESHNLDIISPFPLGKVDLLWRWQQQFKTIAATDDMPKDRADFEQWAKTFIPQTYSFGVIDRDGKLKINHPAPLIGALFFEPLTALNGYLHILSTRRAWGSHMIDEATSKIIDYLLESDSSLLRVSAWMLEKNGPGRALAKRVGLHEEGVFMDSALQGGEPQNIVHYGLTRREWLSHRTPPIGSDTIVDEGK